MERVSLDKIDVNRDISPNDEMWEGKLTHYFAVGRSALEGVARALDAARISVDSIRDILDLPCGHGRVLRYLKAAFPSASITACDLLKDGVDYCAKTFGATPVYSKEDPTQVPLKDSSFDLVWVGSLLTHIDAARWPHFLQFFRRTLRPGGVLVFTAHGHRASDWAVSRVADYGISDEGIKQCLRSFQKTGFGYATYPKATNYGFVLSRPDWVFRQIESIGDLRVAMFSEAAWDNHHDIYACIRDPEWRIL